MSGLFKSSKQKSAQSTSVQLPAWMDDKMHGNADQAQALAGQGFQAWDGPSTTGLTGGQQTAMGVQQGLTGYQAQQVAAPTGQTHVTAGDTIGQMGGLDKLGINGADLSGYYDPYVSNVVNAAYADIDHSTDQQLQTANGSAAMSGAFGGDRAAIQQAELMGAGTRTKATLGSQLRSQAFQRSQDMASADINRQLGAVQTQNAQKLAADTSNQQTDTTYAGYGLQAGLANQNADLAAANVRGGAANNLFAEGEVDRQAQEAGRQFDYGEFLRGINDPYNKLSWSQGITAGMAPYYAQQNTKGYTPGPSGFTTILGLGSMLAGAGGMLGGGGGPGAANGGVIGGFADGGEVEAWRRLLGVDTPVADAAPPAEPPATVATPNEPWRGALGAPRLAPQPAAPAGPPAAESWRGPLNAPRTDQPPELVDVSHLSPQVRQVIEELTNERPNEPPPEEPKAPPAATGIAAAAQPTATALIPRRTAPGPEATGGIDGARQVPPPRPRPGPTNAEAAGAIEGARRLPTPRQQGPSSAEAAGAIEGARQIAYQAPTSDEASGIVAGATARTGPDSDEAAGAVDGAYRAYGPTPEEAAGIIEGARRGPEDTDALPHGPRANELPIPINAANKRVGDDPEGSPEAARDRDRRNGSVPPPIGHGGPAEDSPAATKQRDGIAAAAAPDDPIAAAFQAGEQQGIAEEARATGKPRTDAEYAAQRSDLRRSRHVGRALAARDTGTGNEGRGLPRGDGQPSELGKPTFAQRLAHRESSGNAAAQNRAGYSGRYQMGAARLADLGMYTPAEGEDLKRNQWRGRLNIPGHPEVKTIGDFLRSPEAQEAAFGSHVADIDKAIDALPDARAYDRDGLRAVAHLGGATGMRRFVESGGRYNPADSNGTRLSDYYRMFAGSDEPPAGLARRGDPTGIAAAAEPQAQPAPGTAVGSGPMQGSGAASSASGIAAGAKPEADPDAEPGDKPPQGFFQRMSRRMADPNNAFSMGLIRAGAGMLASRSPGHAGIGEGIAQGIEYMGKERELASRRLDRKEARADRRESARANREDRQLTREQLRMSTEERQAETARHNRMTELNAQLQREQHKAAEAQRLGMQEAQNEANNRLREIGIQLRAAQLEQSKAEEARRVREEAARRDEERRRASEKDEDQRNQVQRDANADEDHRTGKYWPTNEFGARVALDPEKQKELRLRVLAEVAQNHPTSSQARHWAGETLPDAAWAKMREWSPQQLEDEMRQRNTPESERAKWRLAYQIRKAAEARNAR